MAPRAYWKGYLKLSLVSCPIALYPATSEREKKTSFDQLNKDTGNRIPYRKVDAETGDEVEQSNIIKGYEVAKGEYIRLNPKSSRRLPSRASERSTSGSSFQDLRSTNCTYGISEASCCSSRI